MGSSHRRCLLSSLGVTGECYRQTCDVHQHTSRPVRQQTQKESMADIVLPLRTGSSSTLVDLQYIRTYNLFILISPGKNSVSVTYSQAAGLRTHLYRPLARPHNPDTLTWSLQSVRDFSLVWTLIRARLQLITTRELQYERPHITWGDVRTTSGSAKLTR